MKKISLLLSIGLLSTISCAKFLDVKPSGKLIPTEVEQFDNLLNNVITIDFHFSDNNRGSSVPGLSDILYMSDKVVKYAFSPSTVNLDRLSSYIFSTPYLNYNNPDYYLEQGTYKALGLFNNAIDGIVDIGMEEDSYGKEVIAQARGARAWALLVTGMTYGPSYNPNGENNTKTIPYRTTASPTVANPDRATVEELYALVQEDLEFAANFAPKMVGNPVRINKATANAILAFMYMNKSDFENMYKHSKLAWDMQLENNGGDINKLMYNYNDLKYETKVPPPSVAEGEDVRTQLLLESPDKIHDKSYSRENMLYRVAPGGGYSLPTQEYLDLFSDGDLRKELFHLNQLGYNQKFAGMGPNGTDLDVTEGIVVKDFRKSKFGSSYNLGITHAELLLMLAESSARTGKAGEAMTALRLLRSMRYTPEAAPIADLSGDALIQEILNERVREMPISTPHRVWDLKRFAREDGKPWCKKQIKRTVMGEQLSADVLSDKYQFELNNSSRNYNPHWNLPAIPGTWAPYKYGNPFNK